MKECDRKFHISRQRACRALLLRRLHFIYRLSGLLSVGTAWRRSHLAVGPPGGGAKCEFLRYGQGLFHRQSVHPAVRKDRLAAGPPGGGAKCKLLRYGQGLFNRQSVHPAVRKDPCGGAKCEFLRYGQCLFHRQSVICRPPGPPGSGAKCEPFAVRTMLVSSSVCHLPSARTPPGPAWRRGHLAVGRSVSFCGTDNACFIVSLFTPPSARTRLAAGRSERLRYRQSLFNRRFRYFTVRQDRLAVGRSERLRYRQSLFNHRFCHFAVRQDRREAEYEKSPLPDDPGAGIRSRVTRLLFVYERYIICSLRRLWLPWSLPP